MACARAGHSVLEEVIACVHYRFLLCLDEAALSNVGVCCRSLACIAAEEGLWQRLVMCQNRLATSRFLGAFSPEAREVASDDVRPGVAACRFEPGASATDLELINWRDMCRQLNMSMAEAPWAYELCEDGCSAALWTELTDDAAIPSAPSSAAQGSNNVVLASQSPHLFWIGGDRMLGIAGGYSPDVVGGASLHPLREVYQLDLPNASGHGSRLTRPDLLVRRLDCGTAGGKLPHGHPSMNGAASDFDPHRKTIFFFGGGAPHSDVTNATTALRLDGWEGESPSAIWQQITTHGSVESGQVPSARQGLKGTVFNDEFVIFGGRMLGGRCTNEVWSLDLSPDTGASESTDLSWRPLECDGQSPSPRVWHGACQLVHGQWFIYGGSTWQFEEPDQPHDFRTLFILHLAERRWSSVHHAPGPEPPWAVAAALVPLGCCQLLLLGGTLPHKLGSQGLNAHSLRQWRTWYSRLDEPFVFDLRTKKWNQHHAAVAATSQDLEQHVAEVYLRSHFPACFIPHRRSVIAFGGSRYFTGEYFNDVLELQLPSCKHGPRAALLGEGRRQESRQPLCAAFQAPAALPRHLQVADGREASLTRGFLGRLRGMLQDGIINQEQFDMMRSPA
ncbi:gefF [Symbiodinium microadriaticum]|nr:gefF [Symbiodinium microadriaticum]